MIKTGIYGGSFNPIHNGHIRLAKQLLRQAGLDEVWFVVSPQNPLKQHADLLDDHLRLEMVRRALEGMDGLVASDYEFHLPRPSYMWHTLQHLSVDYPERSFTLLIGGDNWERFGQWYEHDKILEHYPIAIYPRSTNIIDESSLPPTVRLLHTKLIDISSTQIRERIRNGKGIRRLVPRCVADYIQENNLYK